MRKFILTILLIMSLYCPKVAASSIDDLFVKQIHPKDLTIEQAEFLHDIMYNKEHKKIKYLNKYPLTIIILNMGNFASFSIGYEYGMSDAISSFLSVSEQEENCFSRPLAMFWDEIWERYKKGEIKKDDNYRQIIFEQFSFCIKKER